MRAAGGGGPARAEAIVPQDVVLVVGIVLAIDQGTKLFAIVLDPGDGSLLRTHGDAVSITVEAVVGVELPALVDEIIIIGTIISDKVTILVGGIINARGAKLEIIVHRVQVGQRVLLRFLPVGVRLLMERVVVRRILGSQVELAALGKVVVGVRGLGVELDALGIGVEAHLEGSALGGLDVGVELAAILVVSHAEAFVIGHVLKTSKCNNVLIFVNGPVVYY